MGKPVAGDDVQNLTRQGSAGQEQHATLIFAERCFLMAKFLICDVHCHVPNKKARARRTREPLVKRCTRLSQLIVLARNKLFRGFNRHSRVTAIGVCAYGFAKFFVQWRAAN